MRTPFVPSPAVLVVACAILLLIGCSRRTTETLTGPAAPATATAFVEAAGSLPGVDPIVEFGPPLPGGAFVDLGPGRVTRSERVLRIRGISENGPPEEWFELERRTWSARVTGEVERNGRRYVVEEAAPITSPDEPLVTWFRQDRSGLFVYQEDLEPTASRTVASLDAGRFLLGVHAWLEGSARSPEAKAALFAAAEQIARRRDAVERALGRATVAFAEPAIVRAGPGGGPAQAEITFLRYPLRPHASWDGRVGFNVWTVEALEWIPSPAGRLAAARLRIDLPKFFGPNDVYRLWYGRPGELRRHAHFEFAVLETEELLELVDYVPGG